MDIQLINPLKQQFETLKVEISARQQSVKELVTLHSQAEAYFQTQILQAEHQDMALSYFVEINKQLKLLGVDLTMLQAARNPDTIEQRQKQAIGRLDLLIGYCVALLQN